MIISAHIIGNTESTINYMVENPTSFNILCMQVLCLCFECDIDRDRAIYWDNTEKFYKAMCTGMRVDRITIKAVLRNLLAMGKITAILDKSYIDEFNEKIKDDNQDIMYDKILDCIVGIRFQPKYKDCACWDINDKNVIEINIDYRHNRYHRVPDNSVRYCIFK